MNKQPQVTEKTRRKLIDSFWKLYKKNDITKITIGEICSKAKYDRTTFYRYFNDINDLINQLENGIINNIRNDIQNNYKHKTSDGIVFNGFKNFNDKYGEYISVFYENGNQMFCAKFKDLIKNDVYPYFNFPVIDESKKEFLFEFMFASLLNSYIYWYSHQNMASLESFVKLTNNMLLNGTKEILKNI